jgi:hypothetical protein
MPTFKAQVADALLDLTWSLWAECGVGGWQRRHKDVAVDVEPLILFTADLGDRDPRLRDEATDWCVRFGELVSKVRLKNVRKIGIGKSRAFAEFAATVKANSSLDWTDDDAKARRFVATGRSELDLARRSVVQLRARAVFGVSARAEILTVLATDRVEATFTATRLAERVQFGRKITAEATDLLSRAGVLQEVERVPSREYRLRRRNEVRALLEPLPQSFPPWPHIFRVLAAIREIAEEVDSRSPVVRAIETQKRLVEVDRHVVRAGLPHIPAVDATPAGWTRLTEWALDVLARFKSAS